MTPYQERIVTEFLVQAFEAYEEQVENQLDSAPLNSPDEDLNEFVDTITGNEYFLIQMRIPNGKTRIEYVADLREALKLFFKALPGMEYDESLDRNLDTICDHLLI